LSQFTTYDQVESFLLSMPRFQDVGARAAHFGIDQIETFCSEIGNPHRFFKSIHVAGTNGKGTVCSMLASIYKEAGYKTGLYTSPHLVDVRERFAINGLMISKEELTRFFTTFEDVINGQSITFFELTTAIAFWYFATNKVDIAIIETGLGGRLDATNIIHPEASVITSIGLDHTEQLGNTLVSVAMEKAGIIKDSKPVILGNIEKSAREVIYSRIVEMNTSVVTSPYQARLKSTDTIIIDFDSRSMEVQSDVLSPELCQNAQISLDTVYALRQTFRVNDEEIVRAFTKIRKNSGLRGRFEKIHPDFQWYFDGAHNSDALKRVVDQSNSLAKTGLTPVFIVTMMKDKLNDEVINILKECEHIFFFELNTPRALKFDEFHHILPHSKSLNSQEMTQKTFLNKFKSNLVLFTGSFYFYSTVIEWMESLTFDS
jgi:dihydrofolate synthase/folylpolyglutamate synthase